MGKPTGTFGVRIKRIAHGKEFKVVLKELVLLWYNNIEDYCWNKEYKSIQKDYKNGKI